jgi:hypothetical protein
MSKTITIKINVLRARYTMSSSVGGVPPPSQIGLDGFCEREKLIVENEVIVRGTVRQINRDACVAYTFRAVHSLNALIFQVVCILNFFGLAQFAGRFLPLRILLIGQHENDNHAGLTAGGRKTAGQMNVLHAVADGKRKILKTFGCDNKMAISGGVGPNVLSEDKDREANQCGAKGKSCFHSARHFIPALLAGQAPLSCYEVCAERAESAIHPQERKRADRGKSR